LGFAPRPRPAFWMGWVPRAGGHVPAIRRGAAGPGNPRATNQRPGHGQPGCCPLPAWRCVRAGTQSQPAREGNPGPPRLACAALWAFLLVRSTRSYPIPHALTAHDEDQCGSRTHRHRRVIELPASVRTHLRVHDTRNQPTLCVGSDGVEPNGPDVLCSLSPEPSTFRFPFSFLNSNKNGQTYLLILLALKSFTLSLCANYKCF
jgi:hypothetical protein